MFSLRRALGVALVALTLAAVDASAAERAVLVLTETKGFRHESIADGKRLLRALGAESSSFDVSFVARSRDLTPKRLSGAEAIVLLNTSGKLPFAKEQATALRGFVRDGGGLVGFHAASDTRVAGFADFPAGVIGARFKKHPFIGSGRVVVEDRSHPATRGLPESFSIEEEFYFFRSNPAPARAGAGSPRRVELRRRPGRGPPARLVPPRGQGPRLLRRPRPLPGDLARTQPARARTRWNPLGPRPRRRPELPRLSPPRAVAVAYGGPSTRSV